MIPLTDEEIKSYTTQKVCYIRKKGFNTDDDNTKYYKVRDHCHYTGIYRGAAHSICNLRYKTPKEIPVIFHNGSTYYYHLIIKKLTGKEEIQKNILLFQYRLKNELDNSKSITYKLKFIDSFRFMSSSLSGLVDNLSEIYSKKCKDKYCKSEWSLKYLEITNFLIGVVSARRKQLKPINGLIKKFPNTYTFCNNDINKFILLLRE